MWKKKHSLRQSGLIWSWLTILIVLLDQITKNLAADHLQLHQPVELLPVFNLILVHNYGGAFSLFSDASGWQRWFFAVLVFVVSTVIVVWLRRMPSKDRWMAIALALILGGALGNQWDRIMVGYVIDFLDVHYSHWHWPVFNVADIAITIGMAMLIIDSLFLNKRRHDEL